MIIISPFPRTLRNGKRNAKEYPYWKELVKLLEQQDKVVQIGVPNEKQFCKDVKKGLPLRDLMNLIKSCNYWISVDNFLQHMAHHIPKPGVVLWGVSDPNIFGYSENINILKSRDNLRKNQFAMWEEVEYNPNVFVTPNEILERIQQYNMNK